MAYTKQNWECGDLITADKMNHIEDGIEDASSGGGTTKLTVNVTESNGTFVMDKTWQEISDAFPNVEVVFNMSGGVQQVGVSKVRYLSAIPSYKVTVTMQNIDSEPMEFSTSTSNGYPTYSEGTVS